jgi:hypothetical protein
MGRWLGEGRYPIRLPIGGAGNELTFVVIFAESNEEMARALVTILTAGTGPHRPGNQKNQRLHSRHHGSAGLGLTPLR